MLELITAWGYLIGSWVNFGFTLEFSDGVSYGGFVLAVAVMSVLVDYIFSTIRRDVPRDSVSDIKRTIN